MCEEQALELVERGENLITSLNFIFTRKQMSIDSLDGQHDMLDEILSDFENYRLFLKQIVSSQNAKFKKNDKMPITKLEKYLAKSGEEIREICNDLPSMAKYFEAVAPCFTDYMLTRNE